MNLSALIPDDPASQFLVLAILFLIAAAFLGAVAGWIHKWMRAQLDEPDRDDDWRGI